MALEVIVISIFLLSNSVSGSFTQVGRYDELQKLGNSCYPRDTCRSLKDITEDHLWGNRTCECGEHCVRHQTCCIDSSYYGMNQFAPKRSDEVCQNLQTRDFMVYMVSTCLVEWQNSYIYEKCIHPENELKDPLSQVPATSIASMTSYKNYFCALCNNDADSAVLWDIEVQMTKNSNSGNTIVARDSIIEKMEYNSEKTTWGHFYVDTQTRKLEFQKILIKFSVKEDLKKFVKPCHPRIISKCSPSYKSTRLRHKCEAYYSPITGEKQGSLETFSYRNIHCALCNGLRANIDTFKCLGNDIKRRVAHLSFTKLLDVNRKDGDIVGRTSVCKDGQVFDPFFKKCRSLVCAMPNHVKKNGACVKSD